MEKIKALILAAGAGSRLRLGTDDLPKPMTKIAGCPILEHNLRLLAKHGIRQVVINLHYRPEAITEYFGDGRRWGMRIDYSYEPEIRGTAGAVREAASHLGRTFLVLYGDNINDIDIRSFLAYHRKQAALGTVAVYWREHTSASGVAEFEASGRMRRFVEKPRPGEVSSHWVNAGVLTFEREILQHIPATGEPDLGRDVLPAVLELGEPLYAYPIDHHLWIDTPEDLERARELERRGELALP